jgi:hypothetical protein
VYLIPAWNPIGMYMSMNFYPQIWVWIFTHNIYTDGQIIILTNLNLTDCHPYWPRWLLLYALLISSRTHLIYVRRVAHSRLLCVVRPTIRAHLLCVLWRASALTTASNLCVVPHAIAASVARLLARPSTLRASSRDATQPCPTPRHSPHGMCVAAISSRNTNHMNEKRIMSGIAKE